MHDGDYGLLLQLQILKQTCNKMQNINTRQSKWPSISYKLTIIIRIELLKRDTLELFEIIEKCNSEIVKKEYVESCTAEVIEMFCEKKDNGSQCARSKAPRGNKKRNAKCDGSLNVH